MNVNVSSNRDVFFVFHTELVSKEKHCHPKFVTNEKVVMLNLLQHLKNYYFWGVTTRVGLSHSLPDKNRESSNNCSIPHANPAQKNQLSLQQN